MPPRSLFDKVWDRHVVVPETDERPAVLHIDLHLLHEVTSPQAFNVLRARGLPCHAPERVFATIDHSTPTLPPGPDGIRPYGSVAARKQVETFEANCREFGIDLNGWGSRRRGVVHVAAPESGRVRPGMTIVCGDSHTATHGAFGSLAFGIGTTEVGHVLATQCLLQRKARSMAINVSGQLAPGVYAKDLILAIIAKIGVNGGVGRVIEYRGEGIRSLPMEGRMTVCNMSIEGGARAGMIAPDDTTIDWVRSRNADMGAAEFDALAEDWRRLAGDDGAVFDEEVEIDAGALAPMITYGTNPGMACAVDAPVPACNDADSRDALGYMGIESGRPMLAQPVSAVFIGSCTNGRLKDLEEAARIMEGRHVPEGVRVLVVPGCETTKAEAEAKGLDRIFLAAGAEWREPGCSMCLAMNGDVAAPGELVVSTSNRNFKGRQGPGARTVLASPATAAAAAVEGKVADPRPLMEGR